MPHAVDQTRVGERLLGVASEGDLLRASMKGANVGAVVADVMASPVTTVPMAASLTELAEVLLEGKLRCTGGRRRRVGRRGQPR